MMLRRTAIRLATAWFLWFIAIPIAIISTIVRKIVRHMRLFKARQVNSKTIVRTPDNRFAGLEKKGYPFAPNYVSLNVPGHDAPLRVHYVDEGSRTGGAQETIVFLHGEPSWSFLYRKMVPGCVRAGYRAIAPDFVGFGKSDKFLSQDDYTHEFHRQTLLAFLDKLELTNVTLVVQDWGGLTGLSCVKDLRPGVVSRLVIMNTGLPTGKEILGGLNAFLLHPFIGWLCFVKTLGQHLPVGLMFQVACQLSREDAAPYAAPFPSSAFKAGVAKWPLLVPIHEKMGVAQDMKASRRYLQKEWAHKPCLVMFSNKDPITKGGHKDFMSLMPNAKQVTVDGAGHFLQETHGVFLAEEIVKFVEETKS